MLDNFESKPLTAEENTRLAIKVRSGDSQAREDVIVGNIALVRYKAKAWVTLYPHLQYLHADMVNEGLVGLVEAINRVAKTPGVIDKNITGLISIAITRAIGHFVSHEETEPKISLPEWYAAVPESHNSIDFVDFVDSLFAACESEEHRIILRMRAEGASEEDIARTLDCSQTTVSVLLDEIRQNFESREELVRG